MDFASQYLDISLGLFYVFSLMIGDLVGNFLRILEIFDPLSTDCGLRREDAHPVRNEVQDIQYPSCPVCPAILNDFQQGTA
jgi:hypothetical protein